MLSTADFMNSYSISWLFCALSGIILIMVPWLDSLSQRFEKTSHSFKYGINALLSCIVIYHIIQEAYISSGVNVLFYAISGFSVAYLIARTSKTLHVQPWPILPWIIAIGIACHGLFDGFAFRMIQQSSQAVIAPGTSDPLFLSSIFSMLSLPSISLTSSHAFFLSLAVLFHRIPEGILIWRLMVKLISRRAAVITLSVLGVSTFFGLVVTDEMLSYSRPIYVNLSYFQVFIAGVILYSAMITLVFRRSTSFC